MQLSVPEGLYKKSAWRPPAVINADEWIHIFILYTFYFLFLALSLLPTLYCTNTIRAISFLLFVLLSSFFFFLIFSLKLIHGNKIIFLVKCFTEVTV